TLRRVPRLDRRANPDLSSGTLLERGSRPPHLRDLNITTRTNRANNGKEPNDGYRTTDRRSRRTLRRLEGRTRLAPSPGGREGDRHGSRTEHRPLLRSVDRGRGRWEVSQPWRDSDLLGSRPPPTQRSEPLDRRTYPGHRGGTGLPPQSADR